MFSFQNLELFKPVISGTDLSVRSSVEAHGARRLGAAIRGLVVEAAAVFDEEDPLKQENYFKNISR